MDIPSLPTKEQIASNLGEWKKYLINLDMLVLAEETRVVMSDKFTKQTQKAQSEIGSLFKNYVTPNASDKVFSPDKVVIVQNCSGSDMYFYDNDGVVIRYLGRVTWELDDYDYFVDRSVVVDGKMIINQTKM